MARVDDNLPGLGQRTLVPQLAGNSLPKNLSQSEGYVLSRVDGRTTLWEITLLVPMRRDDTLRILRRLRADGVIEIPGSKEPMPVGERTAPAPPPAKAAPAAPPPVTATHAQTAGTSARSQAEAVPPALAQTVAASRPPELMLLLDDEEEPAPARPAALPSAPPLSPLELELSAPPQRVPTPRPASTPTPVPSLRSYVSPQAVFAAQPAVEGAGRSRTSPRQASRNSPDLSDLSMFQPSEPLPEVEVIHRSSRASGLIDDTRPSRRTEPPRQSGPSRASVPSSPPHGRPAAVSSPAAASSVPPRPGGASVPAAPTRSTASSAPPRPAAPPGEECELSPEQRRRIDEVHAQLSIADAFTLLGITAQDDRKVVQRAYFKLSKEFHPDRFFKKQLGPYRQRIASVFQAITEARDILVDDDRRARYLAGEPQG